MECCVTNKKIIKVYDCIFAVAWTYDDGTSGCGLEGSDRDCHWCYKYLEQKTLFKEENCRYGRMIGYAKHPSLPSEKCSVFEVLYLDGSFAWWDVGVEMYDRLEDAVSAGWVMEFNWKKEGEELAKTYYTKCGREFKKNSKAAVTGYHISQDDKECENCPFEIEVTEGWGENKRHIRWECRAGSKPPNHTNDWIGSLEDKNTIQIRSLDNDFLEAVLEYCEEHPELSAGYNQDMDDCRRVISVSCSQNKKGIAAKKSLVEKFFGPVVENDEVQIHEDKQCYKCRYMNHETLWCEVHKIVLQTFDRCSKYEEVSSMFLDDDKKCKLQNEKCGHYCKHNEGCSLLIVSPRVIKEVIDTTKNPDETCSIYKQAKEKYGPKICDSCANGYDGGCLPPASKDNCIAYVEKKEKVSNVIQEFDYSTVDEETAEFLQEKANRITEIRMKSVIAIGKELKEAQDRLANHRTGTFGTWVQSIGLSRQTVQNYIQAYDYIVKNFDNIEAAENIQPSLLFAVSKPSAPKELQEKVLSGDIKTHKEYKELEARLKQTESELEEEVKLRQKAETAKAKAEKDAINFYHQSEEYRIQASQKQIELEKRDKQIRDLKDQLEKAQESGNNEQIKTLQEALRALREERDELQSQLEEKPIEVTAVQVKEIIPEEIESELQLLREQSRMKFKSLLDSVINLYPAEIDALVKTIASKAIKRDMEDINLLKNAIDKLQHILVRINNQLNTDDRGNCGTCRFADMDKDEEKLEENLTWCTLEDTFVDFEHTCMRYEPFA